MNQKRHKKALSRAVLVLMLCLPPIGYLAYQYQNNLILDIEEFGYVPDFAMLFHNNAKGMTHIDTTHHVSIVAILKDTCANGCEAEIQAMQR